MTRSYSLFQTISYPAWVSIVSLLILYSLTDYSLQNGLSAYPLRIFFGIVCIAAIALYCNSREIARFLYEPQYNLTLARIAFVVLVAIYIFACYDSAIVNYRLEIIDSAKTETNIARILEYSYMFPDLGLLFLGLLVLGVLAVDLVWQNEIQIEEHKKIENLQRDLSSNCAELQAQELSLRQSLTQSRQQNTKMAQTNNSLIEELQKADGLCQSLRVEKDSEVTRLTDEVASLKERIKQFLSKTAELEREKLRLSSENQHLFVCNAGKSSLEADLRDANTQKAQLQTELKVAAELIETQKGQISKLTEELIEVGLEMTRVKMAHHDRLRQLEDEISGRLLQIIMLEDETRTLRGELERSSASLHGTQLLYEQEREILRQEITELRTNLQTVQEELEAKASEYEAMSKARESLQMKAEGLEREIQSAKESYQREVANLKSGQKMAEDQAKKAYQKLCDEKLLVDRELAKYKRTIDSYEKSLERAVDEALLKGEWAWLEQIRQVITRIFQNELSKHIVIAENKFAGSKRQGDETKLG